MMPRPNATIWITLLAGRLEIFASPKRHATPTRPRRRSSNRMSTQAASASSSSVARIPPSTVATSLISLICQYNSADMQIRTARYTIQPLIGLVPASLRNTRSGGTRRSASNGGSAKPISITIPVA